MEILAARIKRQLFLETGKWGRCAIYENELQRIWPLNEENRKGKIEQFAKEYGFRLSFYKPGLCAIFEKENDEPYEVVVKHDLIGVLHHASFQTFNQAYAYLRACWAKLPVDCDIYIEFGGAIYDKHNARKRVLAFGADHLTEENRDKFAF